MKRDVYQEVTDRIIDAMESGGKNWVNPMVSAAGGWAFNGVTKKPYNGINVLLLGLQGGGAWASYKQWESKGCQVRKGEKGTRIVFFKAYTKKDKETGEEATYPVIRDYTVFRYSQVDGEFAEQFAPGDRVDETDVIAHADEWIANSGADIRHADEGRAFYVPSQDFIQVPPRDGFKATDHSSATENYYSTVCHELAHWTGHKSRLDRLADKSRDGYAFEELVAELGAAFQCVQLGISSEPRQDHAHYLNNWLAVLKEDKRAIVRAAAAAQRAVDFIAALQNKEQAA